MSHIVCPNCQHKIQGIRAESPAILLVLHRAKEPTSMLDLATAYMIYSDAELGGARKAIERLVGRKLLKRVRVGMYQTTPTGALLSQKESRRG